MSDSVCQTTEASIILLCHRLLGEQSSRVVRKVNFSAVCFSYIMLHKQSKVSHRGFFYRGIYYPNSWLICKAYALVSTMMFLVPIQANKLHSKTCKSKSLLGLAKPPGRECKGLLSSFIIPPFPVLPSMAGRQPQKLRSFQSNSQGRKMPEREGKEESRDAGFLPHCSLSFL